MPTIRLKVTVPESRRMTITLPEEVAPGPTEIAIDCRPIERVASMDEFWRAFAKLRVSKHPRRSTAQLDAELSQERTSWE